MLSYSESRDFDTVKRAIKACDSSLPVFRIVPMHGKRNYTYYVNDNIVVQFPLKETDGKEIIDRAQALDYLAPRLPFRIGLIEPHIGEWHNKPLAMRVSPRIEGFTLNVKAFKETDEKSKKYVFDQLAYFLVALHEITKQEMKPFNIPSSEKLIVNRLREANKFGPLLLHFAKILGSEERLCHNDCHTRNIHVDSAFNLLGVFDFDGLSFGNPVWDLAIPSYTYQEVKMFQKSYEDEAGRKLQEFDLAYLARVTIAHIASVQEYLAQIKSRKGSSLTPKEVLVAGANYARMRGLIPQNPLAGSMEKCIEQSKAQTTFQKRYQRYQQQCQQR